MVLIFAEVSGLVSYQYVGWRFELSSQYTQNAMGPELSTMDTSIVNGELYISELQSMSFLSVTESVTYLDRPLPRSCFKHES